MVNRASTPPSNNMHLLRISSPPSIVGVPATFSPPSAPWISPPVPHSPPLHLRLHQTTPCTFPSPPLWAKTCLHHPPFDLLTSIHHRSTTMRGKATRQGRPPPLRRGDTLKTSTLLLTQDSPLALTPIHSTSHISHLMRIIIHPCNQVINRVFQ